MREIPLSFVASMVHPPSFQLCAVPIATCGEGNSSAGFCPEATGRPSGVLTDKQIKATFPTFMQPEDQEKSNPWLSRVVSAILGILITVVAALIIGKLQSRDPHLGYTVVSSIPFSGASDVVSIYQINVINDGKREVQRVTCYMRVAGGKIEQYKTSVAPSISVTQTVAGDSLTVQISSLNPTDTATISLLASGAGSLPSRPEVSIRASGVNGEEKTESTQQKEFVPTWSVLLSGLAAVTFSAGLLPFVRRIVGGSSQARVLERICRTHGLMEEAEHYSKLKGRVWYRIEADRLTMDALQVGTAGAFEKAEKILLALTTSGQITSESCAIVLVNLARIEASKGNESAANHYLNLARSYSNSAVEERLRIVPLPVKLSE
jgi:hypothetical protein